MIGSPRAGAPAARRWREPRPQIPARPAPRRRIHWPPFVRDAASYSGGSLASQLSTVVYNVALRRILAPAVMGLFDFVTVVLNFTLSFDPGISAAATIKLPALKGAGDEEGATVLRSTAFWAELAQALLMAAGIGVFILVGGATGELATAAAVAAATVVLYCMQDSLTTMHQGHQSWVAMSGALVAASLLGVALLPGGALIAGIRGLFIGSIALWTLRVALLWLTARRVGIVIESRFDWAGFRSLMGLGFPLRLVDFPQAIIAALDGVLVAQLLGIKALAIYSFARLVFLQVSNIPAVIGNVFVTRVFRMTGANVARGELARDAKDFLLLEYLVLLPALVCLAVQAFGFITATVVHGYARSDSVLTFLILASFFVPQTTIVRNFWMLDRRFVKLAASNVIGLLTHGLGLGGAILINGLSITSIAIGTLIGWAGYYLWMMGTIGRELWGSRSAAGVGLHALLGAGITAGVVALLPALSGHPGAGAAFAQSAWKLLLSLLLVAPLAAYGLRRTGALAHFRQPGAVT